MEHRLNELQQLQLRAQILVYGALAQGLLPEEALMMGAFSDTSTGTGVEDAGWDDGRSLWQEPWVSAKERLQGNLTANYQGRAKLHTWRPGYSTALPHSLESRPRAVRTALQPACDETSEGTLKVNEASTRLHVQNAQTTAASLEEHCEDFYEQLREQCSSGHPRPEFASAAISLGAAASAGRAAAAAAKLAQQAVWLAKRVLDGTRISDDEQDEWEDVDSAVEHVSRAVFQARAALWCASKTCAVVQDCSARKGSRLMDALEESDLSEGLVIEVMSKPSGLWRTAKVLTVQDGSVCVAGDDSLKEWISIEPQPRHRPNIRPSQPNSTRKRWRVGDFVDVKTSGGWREGIVSSISRGDRSSSAIIFFPAEGILENVDARDLRPSLLWRDNKWVVEKDAEDFDTAEHISTGPPVSYKTRNIVDVMLDEKERLRTTNEKMVAKSKMRRSGSIPSNVRKAKSLISKAKPYSQVSSSRKRKKPTLGDPSKAMKRHQVLKEMVRLRALTKRSTTQARQQRPQRLIQPTPKLLEGLENCLGSGGKQALLF